MNFPARGLLFDLDGTLVHSILAVDRAWTRFALRHGLSPAEVLPRIHGRRALDSIRLLLPNVNADAENLILRQWETEDTEGIVEVPGAAKFLKSLPKNIWGIVTSGTLDVATARIYAAGLPFPCVLITGEQVANGKPSPDPYLLGAKSLGVPPNLCLAFEDVGAGYRAAKLAGMIVVAISDGVQLPDEADFIVPNFRSASYDEFSGILSIE